MMPAPMSTVPKNRCFAPGPSVPTSHEKTDSGTKRISASAKTSAGVVICRMNRASSAAPTAAAAAINAWRHTARTSGFPAPAAVGVTSVV